MKEIKCKFCGKILEDNDNFIIESYCDTQSETTIFYNEHKLEITDSRFCNLDCFIDYLIVNLHQ